MIVKNSVFPTPLIGMMLYIIFIYIIELDDQDDGAYEYLEAGITGDIFIVKSLLSTLFNSVQNIVGRRSENCEEKYSCGSSESKAISAIEKSIFLPATIFDYFM